MTDRIRINIMIKRSKIVAGLCLVRFPICNNTEEIELYIFVICRSITEEREENLFYVAMSHLLSSSVIYAQDNRVAG